ncbi:hypothetical protein [Maribacter flavus]|uniref:hypothetical protein n=1 Tax=Maribacter flavus TaxID=1658664 RepID=UPI0013757FD8|nr:hypothetical protein [Maribacter flavus]
MAENESELVQTVAKMRKWQKEYFKTRDKEALKNSKYWEKRVDHLLEKPNTLFS